MHLLQIQEEGRFRLVEHIGRNIPPYAILSHTWGADHEEVTFKDLIEGTGKNKAGYYKLTFCGKQAAQDGLQFFWVDTCCIDKSSSQQLSEAINSMFQWYQKADKCYVYLSDVSVNSALPDSRWFTRGWTLQELLAPTSVEFFSVEGERLGSRISFLQDIHTATGISIQALQGGHLSQFSIDERLSWANSRETKREEDMAYSLLGIFDVHMPLIYGEGQEKAFIRLLKKIERSQRDELHREHRPFSAMSLRRTPDFTERPYTPSPLVARMEDLGVNEVYKDGRGSRLATPLSKEDALDSTTLEAANERHLICTREAAGTTEGTRSRLQDSEFNNDWLVDNPDLSGENPENKRKMPLATSMGSKLYRASKHDGTNQVEMLQYVIEELHNFIPPSGPQSNLLRRPNELEEYMKDKRIHDWNEAPNVKKAVQLLFGNIRRRERLQSQKAVNDWLDVTKFDHYHDIGQYYDKQVSSRLEGTCEWIFSHPAYREWISEDPAKEAAKLLWICAPAGFGKTMLCARLVEHLKDMQSSFPTAFFFASPHAQSGGEPSFIIRSWIAQLAQLDLDILELIQGRSDAGQRASESDIWSIFKSILSQNRNYTFVLDGFDEYARLDDNRAEFLQKLKNAAMHSLSRILILSRDETDIKAELSPRMFQGPGLVILECRISSEDIQHDISLFSRSVVDKKLQNKDDHLRQNLARQLAEKCDGMFLWIKLQQDQLRSGKNAKQLQNIVKSMPTGLLGTYERNWKTIQSHNPDDKSRALAILKWTTFALRPLTVSEITHTLIVDADDDGISFKWDELPDDIDEEYINSEIIDICAALIEVRSGNSGDSPGSRTVHLIHPSVREFLVSALLQNEQDLPKRLSEFQHNPVQANYHKELAQICLAYLNYSDTWRRSSIQEGCEKNYPFTDYAAKHWHLHMTAAGKDDAKLVSLAQEFLRFENSSFHHWRKYIESSETTPADDHESSQTIAADGHESSETAAADSQEDTRAAATPLYYAAYFDLTATMEYIWAEDETQLNRVGGEYGTPLQAACSKGNNLAFNLLIGWGADPNVKGGKFGVPINAAIAGGHRSIAEALIRIGTNLALKDSAGQTPLFTAAANGDCEMIDLLVKAGAELKTIDKYETTPLTAASGKGHLEVVKLLLANGADLTATDDHGRTPVYTASLHGHIEVVRFLLKNEADVTIANKYGWTPLNCAASNGHLEVVKLLLEKGADTTITTATDEGWTPIHVTSFDGQPELVKLLFEHGADVTVPANNGWTPLNSASERGHLEIVKFLLEHGADLTVPNNEGWTPLNSASDSGRLEVIKLLLEHGADLTVPSTSGWTPLNSAADSGHLEVVKLFLEHGADMTVPNNDGWTPLNSASDNGHLEVVKLLLEHGADITIPANNGWTPLNSASDSGHLEVVRILLEHGADMTIPDKNGWTPLNSASNRGHLEVVKLLLEHGAEITVPANDGWSPLNSAANKGHFEVVKFLLERGADMTTPDKNGWTPLNSASNSGHLEVVKLLLDHGADMTISANNGWTPLNLASNSGHLEVAKLLLDKGADVATVNCNGWTPLNSASDSGRFEVIKLLLEHGADMTTAANNGWTPLNSAAESGHLEIVKLFLELGADMTIPNNNGWTPLNTSSRNGHLEVVKLLLEKGADVAAVSNDGWSPLNSASNSGHLEVVKFLLKKGADITVPANPGWTPLHSASDSGHLEVVKFLLEEGADIHIANKDGATPVYSASLNGHLEIVKRLIDNGADVNTQGGEFGNALQAASAEGHEQIVRVLLDGGADVNAQDGRYSNALQAASEGGHEQIVELLRDKGAVLQAEDRTSSIG